MASGPALALSTLIEASDYETVANDICGAVTAEPFLVTCAPLGRRSLFIAHVLRERIEHGRKGSDS